MLRVRNPSGSAPKQEKTITADTSVISVTPDSGKLLSKVTVNPTPSETMTVTAGTSDITVSPSSGKLLSSVIVQPMKAQEKYITPGASGKTVTPDSGFRLVKVTVNGDADLVPENIKSGIKIFGVSGTLTKGVGNAFEFSINTTPNVTTDQVYVMNVPVGFRPQKVMYNDITLEEDGRYTRPVRSDGSTRLLTLPLNLDFYLDNSHSSTTTGKLEATDNGLKLTYTPWSSSNAYVISIFKFSGLAIALD